LRHISFALGSLSELETQLLISERLGYLNNVRREDLLRATSEIGRMLNGLQVSLSSRKR
jgi:four helix bundle protein